MENPIVSPETMKASKVLGRVTEALRMLEEGGLPFRCWQWIVDDPDFRRRLLDFWRTKGGMMSEPNIGQITSLKRAKDILGVNCLDPKLVEKHLGVKYSEKELEELARVPWSEEVLMELKDTHVLVAGYPLSIMEIRERAPKKTFYSYGDSWYNNQKFAIEEKVGLRWYLIRKDIVPGSGGKPYDEQKDLLGKNEEVPAAVEMVYLMTLYYLATGTKLFTSHWVRCRDLDSRGNRVGVLFYEGRLYVDYWWSGYRNGSLGLSSARKFQS